MYMNNWSSVFGKQFSRLLGSKSIPLILLFAGRISVWLLLIVFGSHPVRTSPDTDTYRYFDFSSLQAMLSSIRTLGYPLLLRGIWVYTGSADVRLYKPLSHSRLYTTVLDIVYKLAFSSEYESPQADAANGAARVLAGHRILLVEDNDINKMIALEMLEETGVDVDVAVNGADAVEQVQQQEYELILMDIQMPVMDGYEATRQIRALGGEFKSIPIIAMTAHALEGDSSRSLEAGLDYHISKPFDPDDLIAIIVRYIEQRRQ